MGNSFSDAVWFVSLLATMDNPEDLLTAVECKITINDYTCFNNCDEIKLLEYIVFLSSGSSETQSVAQRKEKTTKWQCCRSDQPMWSDWGDITSSTERLVHGDVTMWSLFTNSEHASFWGDRQDYWNYLNTNITGMKQLSDVVKKVQSLTQVRSRDHLLWCHYHE